MVFYTKITKFSVGNLHAISIRSVDFKMLKVMESKFNST